MGPTSPKRSCTPIFSMGVGQCAAQTSATADPKPFSTLWFSAVTIAPVSRAQATTSSSSIGLIVKMLTL